MDHTAGRREIMNENEMLLSVQTKSTAEAYKLKTEHCFDPNKTGRFKIHSVQKEMQLIKETDVMNI
jgi:hypothetical protein